MATKTKAASKAAVAKAAAKPTRRPRQMAPQAVLTAAAKQARVDAGDPARAAATRASRPRPHHQAPKPNGAAKKWVGQRMPRKEDPRLIQGISHYTDDLRLAGLLHCVFVRSPHAHAKVNSINTDAARQSPGVVAVYTAADLGALGNIPCAGALRESTDRTPPDGNARRCRAISPGRKVAHGVVEHADSASAQDADLAH